jgi:hypothetical protein
MKTIFLLLAVLLLSPIVEGAQKIQKGDIVVVQVQGEV